MGAKNLYTIKSGSKPSEYVCVKFDMDSNPEETYTISVLGADAVCSCVAGTKNICRHRTMLKLFHKQDLIDKGWLYHFEKAKWQAPMGVADLDD